MAGGDDAGEVGGGLLEAGTSSNPPEPGVDGGELIGSCHRLALAARRLVRCCLKGKNRCLCCCRNRRIRPDE